MSSWRAGTCLSLARPSAWRASANVMNVSHPCPSTPTFWGLVEAAADHMPDAIVIADDIGRRMSAADFALQSERTAAGLSQAGVGRGDTVSWQLPTTLESAVLMAALSRLGAVQNPIIPAFGEREVRFVVGQLAPTLAVVAESWRGADHGATFRSLGVQVLQLDLEGDLGEHIRLPVGDPSRLPTHDAAAGECRWIYYSSGTTGVPKGSRHTDASVMASSNGVVDGLGMRSDDIYPIAWPFAHIGGISMLSASLRTGGMLVLFKYFEPAASPEQMAGHRPTILGSATPFFQAYVAAQQRHGARPLFPKLRACVGGGAATPDAVNRDVSEVLGVRRVVGAWGLTEFPVASSETPDDPDVGTSVGRPAAGVEVRVVDHELRLKGPQCFLGYVDGSLNGEVFDDEGWLRTGDLGSIDAEGRIHVEGRCKDIVIRNAENISAAEVEDVVARHAAVVEVAVVGIPDDRAGERVCAVVVLQAGQQLELAHLVEHCLSEGFSRYKCPERLLVVDRLPRNSMGKVRKDMIRSDPRLIG